MRRAIAIAVLFAACNRGETARLYHTEDKAPSLEWGDIEAMDHMGPTLIDLGVNFALYSARAQRIELLLFDDPESDLPTQRFPLTRAGGDVWNLYVEGIGLGTHYGFAAWGPNWPYEETWRPGQIDGFIADVDAEGNRFNPNKLLFDPYAKALHRDHDWSRGSTATGPARTQSTWGAGTKGIIIDTDTYEWSANEATWREMRRDPNAPGHSWRDVVVYEVHAKGFTKESASGVDNPGTYRGIGEKAQYLADLGITAVELLPIHEKPLDGGYWGYNNLNYFAPELTYSSAFLDRNAPHEVIDEFKWMVDQLHQAGVEVIVDVVYNHTGEGGFWREKLFTSDINLDPGTSSAAVNLDPKEVVGLYSFRGLDNWSYYALSADNQTYHNNTGVGNQTRPNNDPMRRLTLDSLEFMIDELHIDGFRFDLAGILGEKDLDYNNWDDPQNTVLQDIIDLPGVHEYNVRIISEPWTAGGHYGPLIGAYPVSSTDSTVGWLEWNARFRDWWRAFLNQDDWKLNSQEADADGGFVITGSQRYYDWNDRKPHTSVNFITAHDGFTMYDLFSFNQKQNQCGVLNPVCCSDPASAWCETSSGDSHNRSRDWGQNNEPMKRQMMRNAFAAMLISHGTPMILGGDEWMRTQYGNNNAYGTLADNEWNWFRWGEWQAPSNTPRYRMHDFVRDMITFRKAHTYALNPGEWGSGMPFAWKHPDNHDGVNWGGKAVMMHYYDDGAQDWGPELAILINMEASDTVQFTPPGGRDWRRVVDTQSWFDLDDGYLAENPELDKRASANIDLSGTTVVDGPYGVPPRAIVILEDFTGR